MSDAVLIVDDEPHIGESLRRLLRRDGYEIHLAERGPTALEVLARTDIAVMICDQQMPGMPGAQVLAEAYKLRPDTVRITLTGYTDLPSAQASINDGRISHFLLKPWDDDQLRAVVRDGVRRFRMERELRQLHELTRRQRDELEAWNRELEGKVLERTAALRAAHDETLDALVLALDSREHATAGHSRRVALDCLYLALDVGVPDGDLEDLHRGALLHDIGKIGVPDSILLNRGRLTPQERTVMEHHVEIGRHFLERISYLEKALAIPRYHHERFDGKGYCEGLAREAIPWHARIFAIVDVYDALRSERSYKQAMSHAQACEIIRAESGKHFDPALAASFLATRDQEWQALARISHTRTSFAEALGACRQIKGAALGYYPSTNED